MTFSSFTTEEIINSYIIYPTGLILNPAAKRGLYAVMLSICLSLHVFVCLSVCSFVCRQQRVHKNAMFSIYRLSNLEMWSVGLYWRPIGSPTVAFKNPFSLTTTLSDSKPCHVLQSKPPWKNSSLMKFTLRRGLARGARKRATLVLFTNDCVIANMCYIFEIMDVERFATAELTLDITRGHQ